MVRLKVDEASGGMRADLFIAKYYPQFARSALQKLFTVGEISLNGKPAKAGDKLKLGDQLRVDDRLLTQPAEKIDLPIIYEDGDAVVIDKPTGVLTHTTGGLNHEGTVASFIRSKLAKDVDGERGGIVHRLDRATSGVIITAKNQVAMRNLQRQFSTRKVDKTYQAIVSGKLEPAMGIIDMPIGRDPRQPKRFKAMPEGRPAQTEYEVEKNFQRGGRQYSLVSLRPKTGRTHQLRVHLASVGHPIVGDELYGGETADRLMLHALALGLTLPSGERKVFESPVPKEMESYAS